MSFEVFDEGYNSREEMNFLLIAISLFLLERNWSSEELFQIQNASREYDLAVIVEPSGGDKSGNDSNVCRGPALVSITRKGAESPFQKLNMSNIEVHRDQIAFNSAIDNRPRKLYDDEHSFIFGDFNFDGKEDLAICNGRSGGYGAPSYSVFLYSEQSKQFVENKRLSRLTEGYLGLFFVDPRKRQIIAYWKSGCCYHETEIYNFVKNRPVIAERAIEKAISENLIKTTTMTLRNGRWFRQVRTVRSHQGDAE